MLKKSKGFTQIEIILVVGIISVLATVVYFIHDNASDKRQVSSEISNISGLIKQVSAATTASNYADLSNQKLLDMGIYYKPEFREFEIKGLSPKSFQVTYGLLKSRVCSDLAMKTAVMKGEYKLTRKINGVDAGFTPVEVANACNTQQNKLDLVFDGLNIQNIASVTPGTPKPPASYAGEGTFTPDYPDRGDVPTNLADASKNTNNPSKPIPGLYKPPEYIVATSPTSPNGNASNPGGSFLRPEYIPNAPLGPLTNPPDNGNEFVPAVPPVPPRPPAIAPPPLLKSEAQLLAEKCGEIKVFSSLFNNPSQYLRAQPRQQDKLADDGLYVTAPQTLRNAAINGGSWETDFMWIAINNDMKYADWCFAYDPRTPYWKYGIAIPGSIWGQENVYSAWQVYFMVYNPYFS